jgi:hypothetical protein
MSYELLLLSYRYDTLLPIRDQIASVTLVDSTFSDLSVEL